MGDLYDVSKYSEEELYQILDLTNPSDRVLEIKIITSIEKYREMGRDDLVHFFTEVYKRFFDTPDDIAQSKEGFESSTPAQSPAPAPSPEVDIKSAVGVPQVQMVSYTRSALNPLLKETTSRTVCINSLYRQDPNNTVSTSFIINLAEPLNNVVELSLSSYQIPFTWYTVNNNYGGNFFYIKGNVEGLDNGSHDYKIQIPSGNYTETAIISTINDKLDELSTLYTDVSFGQTAITYNSSTAKTTFNLEITKLFNQSNYYLEFPYDPFETLPGNKDNLGRYLGYEQKTYNCISIISEANLSLTPNIDDTINSVYTITNTNYRFQIIQYTGTDYYSPTESTVIETINVDLTRSSTNVSRNNIMTDLSNVLHTHIQLDHDYSSIQRINITDTKFENTGSSYFKLNIKLNRYTTKNIKGTKIVLIFPEEPSGAINNIWTGTTSCFRFEYLENEIGQIIAETPMIQSSYVVSGTMQIKLQCASYPYNVHFNDYIITIPNSNSIGYTYREYITAINTAIINANTTDSISVPGNDLNYPKTSMDTNPEDNHLDFKVDLTRTFTNNYYTLDVNHKYIGIFTDTLANGNVFENTFVGGTYSLEYTDVITIIPKMEYSFVQNQNAGKIELTIESLLNEYEGNEMVQVQNHVHYIRYFKMLNLGFDTAYTKSLMLSEGRNADYLDTPTLLIRKIRDYKTFTGFLDLQTKMNNLFVQYKDYLGNTPFANSRIEFTVLQGNQIKSTFTLNISKTLTQLNYNAIFYDSLSNAQTPNRWTEKLYFSPQYSFTSIPNMSYSLIKNAQAISDNQIKLEDGINNAFTFKTYSDINGLHTNTDIYEVKIVIPPGIYTQNQLYTAINTQFLANPLTQYSKVGSFTERNKEYTRFDVNIYKSFTTKDYRLVFYDPLSFAQCNSSGANKTIQNAKWDSTLGWILGFRSQPVYYLDEYTSISDPSQLIYFNSSNTNQCILNSDTCVSVSLFNSFMIIFDDFNQNHLNDGLVTTSPQQEDLDLGLNNTYVCDPITNTKVLSVVGNTEGKTANQIYALQQKYLAKQTKARPYSTAASIKDVFAIIPITTGKFTVGQIISETGGSLRAQTRIYFGPVNIRRVSVKLMNERGDLLDLNGQNWSFTIEATILTDRPKTASGQQSTSGAKA